VLAQQVVAAEKEPGRYRAIVNLRLLTLLKWVDDPMPGVAWENDAPHKPSIHPDDLETAKQMSAQLATAPRTQGVIRLRSMDGGWIPVSVTARLMLLDQHTTAALVTIEAQGPNDPLTS